MSKWVKSVFSDRSDHARSYSVSDCDSDRVGGHNVPIPTKVQRNLAQNRLRRQHHQSRLQPIGPAPWPSDAEKRYIVPNPQLCVRGGNTLFGAWVRSRCTQGSGPKLLGKNLVRSKADLVLIVQRPYTTRT